MVARAVELHRDPLLAPQGIDRPSRNLGVELREPKMARLAQLKEIDLKAAPGPGEHWLVTCQRFSKLGASRPAALEAGLDRRHVELLAIVRASQGHAKL